MNPISISERLPQTGERVLVYIWMSYFKSDGGYWELLSLENDPHDGLLWTRDSNGIAECEEFYRLDQTTHWMPLPDKPSIKESDA